MLPEERRQVFDLIIQYRLDENMVLMAVFHLLDNSVPFDEIIVWLRMQGMVKTEGISV